MVDSPTPEERAEELGQRFAFWIAPHYETAASVDLGNLFRLARGRTDYQNTKLLKIFLKALERKLDE